MKHKIMFRLIGYFSSVLLLFSIIAGAMFCWLFSRHTAEIQTEDLKVRAVSIAATLSDFSKNGHGRGMGGGYGAYLRFIDEIAMSEVWLVDERMQSVRMGHMGSSSLSYEELPESAERLINQVFEGKVEATKEFSSLLNEPSVTVGAPVRDGEGNVEAALLLHSPISGMDKAQKDGMSILLFCILTALVLASVLAFLLANRFIGPLKKMEKATRRIMEGDYSVCTEVVQQDEIGSLAHNIDLLSKQLSVVEGERKTLDKMRQDFVSNISHELRTPVTVIKGSLEVLNEGLISTPGEMQEYFRQMLADTTHLERLVNDLLELSRLQNTNFKIEKTELNIVDPLMEAVRSIQRVADQKHIGIKVENEAGAIHYQGDYGRLRQMFTNILENAVKFSSQDDIVAVNIYHDGDMGVIDVTDHGSGILPKDIPNIFERFYKERSEQNKSGSGLGLSITKQIAKRHEIDIGCTSEPGKYTTFHFCFRIET